MKWVLGTLRVAINKLTNDEFLTFVKQGELEGDDQGWRPGLEV
jgi:hypothetical protein